MTTPTTATGQAPPAARPSPAWPNTVSGSTPGPLAALLVACVLFTLRGGTLLMSINQILITGILITLTVIIDRIPHRRAS